MQTIANQRGVSLLTAIFIGLILSSVGYVTVHQILTDLKNTGSHAQGLQAYWLAESGMERALRYLRITKPPPGGTAPITYINREALGPGVITVTIDPDDDNPSSYLKRYTITSRGEVGSISRTLRIQVQTSTFGEYAYLSGDENGNIWFTTNDLIEGPLHSNDQIAITGSPVFKGKVTSSAKSFKKGTNFNPDFQEGYQLGVPKVTFPGISEIIKNYQLETGNSTPVTIDARYNRDAEIVFKPDGTLVYSVWRKTWGGKKYIVKDKVLSLSSLNGMLLVKGDVRVKGQISGQLTLIATDNIYIVDDLVYADSDPAGKPNPKSKNLLGLASEKNIVIADNKANRKDVRINGALLALGTSFTVQNYNKGKPRGVLTLYGSLSQKVRGPVGTFNKSGIKTGYSKNYHFDTRFSSSSPPYFPITGQYKIFSWREVEQ